MKKESQNYEEWILKFPQKLLPLYTSEELQLLYFFEQLPEADQLDVIKLTKDAVDGRSKD